MTEECSVDVLKLEHYPVEDFEHWIWQREDDSTSLLYFAFLRILDFYGLGMIIWSLVLSFLEFSGSWIFFEFWILCIFQTQSFSIKFNGRLFYHYKDDYVYMDHMPWYYKMNWILFSAALPASFLSCIVFWSQVYNKNTSKIFFMVLNIATPACTFLNFILSAFPLRLLNFFYFVIFYMVYIVFTVFYQKFGGTGLNGSIPIYRVLDWRNPGKASLAAFIGLLIGETIYICFCFLSMLKLLLRDRFLYS